MANERERFEAADDKRKYGEISALRKWEQDTGRPASASEGNAFMDGYYAGWQAHAESVGPADDYDQKAVDVIKNLAMLVRRLARRLEKHEPGCKMVTQALEYLRGENLQGSILREAESLSGDGRATQRRG